MNNFDLRKIHELIPFHGVCDTPHEYMAEASRLPRVELCTEALYVLTPNTSLLFTPKLHYYRLVVENEINRHINAATELLEADGSEELTKFVLKKTREAVTTLMNEAKAQLATYDWGCGAWKTITYRTYHIRLVKAHNRICCISALHYSRIDPLLAGVARQVCLCYRHRGLL